MTQECTEMSFHHITTNSWSEFAYEYAAAQQGDRKFMLQIMKDVKFVRERQELIF